MPFPPMNAALARALAARAYAEPTPVQLAVLEGDAAGRDQLVSAQTGSGKTVAFGLAIAPTLLGSEERFGPAAAPAALIIAPTRELAMQVQRELIWLYAETGARVVTCVGGMDVRAEARTLANGAHIVVGTPGRLRDHLERKRLDLGTLKAVVLDEADEMLDLGFREDLEFILEATPAERQTLLFSATVPREIEALAQRYQRNAKRIETLRRNEQHADIEYRALRVAPSDVENAIVNVLRMQDARATLVFCATREAVKRLHANLVERGFSASALSGELTQSERTQALQVLRDGRARVLVATDVAARGLDLPDLALVIHADLPVNRDTLLHRSGRTGRAGKKGLSILIVPFNRRRKAEALLGAARISAIWGNAPTADEIRARDQDRFLADPIFTDAAGEEDLALKALIQSAHTPDAIALALVRLQRAKLPAPEDLTEAMSAPWQDRNARPDRFKRNDRHDRPARHDRPERTDAPRSPRPQRPGREEGREMVWFRLNIGRERNADPRWLLPLICKAGDITKAEIGAIKIFDRDTRFQIAADHADNFANAVRLNKTKEGHISRLGEVSDSGPPAEPANRPSQPPPARDKPRPPAGAAPHKRFGAKPWRKHEGDGKGSPRPHGDAKPSAPGGSPPRPQSKYAHKKKHRGPQSAQS